MKKRFFIVVDVQENAAEKVKETLNAACKLSGATGFIYYESNVPDNEVIHPKVEQNSRVVRRGLLPNGDLVELHITQEIFWKG